MAAENEAVAARRIFETATAFQRSRVLLTAYELGVFTVLNEELRTSGEVAEAVGADVRATDRLLNALVAVGFLDKAGDRFSNTPEGARLLVKGRPGYVALGHTVDLWSTWTTMTEAVRRGRPVPRPEINERGDHWLRSFIAAMHYRARQTAPEIVATLDLAAVSRVLDVGGGSGIFSMAFVRTGAGLSAVVFDLPNVVPLTRSYVEVEGFSARITTVEGNYLSDELPAGFDLVFLSAIVHANSSDQNRQLIAKAARSLNPGGQVVVVDWIMNEARTEPAVGALFALNMLVGTEGGDTYTEAEVRDWMSEAGLAHVTRRDTSAGLAVVVGRV